VTSVVRSSAGCSEPEIADRHADLTSPLSVHVRSEGRPLTRRTRLDMYIDG